MRLVEAHQWSRSPEGIQAGREYMEKPMMIEHELTILYARMDAVRESMHSALSMTEGKGQSLPGDKTGEIASLLCDLERQIEQRLHLLPRVRREREILVAGVEDFAARLALRYHCLEHLTSAAAAARLHMEERQYYRKLRLGYSLIAMQLAIRNAEEET